MVANLTDYYPPIANFIPANDTINPSQDVLIQFNEPIRLINNTNVDNTNIQSLFTLAYADTGTSSIDFVASVDDDDQQFTLNPVSKYFVIALPSLYHFSGFIILLQPWSTNI